VSGLFLQLSPDKVKTILEAAEKSDVWAIQLSAHSLKSSSACIGAMYLSALVRELEMMGRSGTLDRAREGAEKLRELPSRLEAETAGSGQQQKPAEKERAIYLQYLQYGYACQ